MCNGQTKQPKRIWITFDLLTCYAHYSVLGTQYQYSVSLSFFIFLLRTNVSIFNWNFAQTKQIKWGEKSKHPTKYSARKSFISPFEFQIFKIESTTGVWCTCLCWFQFNCGTENDIDFHLFCDAMKRVIYEYEFQYMQIMKIIIGFNYYY